MATTAHELHVIYDPAVSTAPFIVEIDTTPTDLPLASGRGARLAAAVLVPLSIALVALRVSGTMRHAIHAGAAFAVIAFVLAFPAYRLARFVGHRVRRADPAAPAEDMRSEPRMVVFNWAWTLSLLWMLSIPLLGFG